MDRPESIVRFERLYLAAFVIGVVNTVLGWSAAHQRMVLQAGEGAAILLPIGTAFGFGVTLLLWYFTARRGSEVAKWIATIFVVLALVWLVTALLQRTYQPGLSGALGMCSTILQGMAVWMLFRPDAKPWFAGRRT